jgi:3-hydroxyisobutyrate dehydrogenase
MKTAGDAASDVMEKPRIALLGTGRMGSPIARNLLAAGFRCGGRGSGARLEPGGVTIASTRRRRGARLLDGGCGCTRCRGGRDDAGRWRRDGACRRWRPRGARRTDAGDDLGADGHDWAGMDRATRGPRAGNGISFVDAPVSGSDGPAQDGKLVMLAAGDESLRSRPEPIFDTIGRRTLWLGAIGNGSALKLVLNGWLASITETAAESVAFTEAVGLDPGLFADTIADSPWKRRTRSRRRTR